MWQSSWQEWAVMWQHGCQITAGGGAVVFEQGGCSNGWDLTKQGLSNERVLNGWVVKIGGHSDKWVGAQTNGRVLKQTGGCSNKWVGAQTNGWVLKQTGGLLNEQAGFWNGQGLSNRRVGFDQAGFFEYL